MKKKYPILDAMLEDMKKAPSLYRPTRFWEYGIRKIVADFSSYGIEQFRSLTSPMSFFVPTYGCPGCDSLLLETITKAFEKNKISDTRWVIAQKQFLEGETQAFSDYRVFLATDRPTHPFLDRVSESMVGTPSEQFMFGGRRFSRSFLNYLLGLNCLKQHCDLSDVKTVLEIGGGFGSLGEILLGDKRNHCFYIDVDIPPTSFIAAYYLQKIFGTRAIGDYGNISKEKSLEIKDLTSRFRGAVLCPWQLPKLKGDIDLFINFISFQEMEPDVVENYLMHVDRLGAKYILLRNIKEGKQKAIDENSLGVKNPIKGEDYDTFLPNYELKTTNTVPFGFLTVDNFHSEIRIYERK